jgi:hypothetical protein
MLREHNHVGTIKARERGADIRATPATIPQLAYITLSTEIFKLQLLTISISTPALMQCFPSNT